ncbi:MAG: DUF3772 domain-containing protein [Pseudomonadota bacterium]
MVAPLLVLLALVLAAATGEGVAPGGGGLVPAATAQGVAEPDYEEALGVYDVQAGNVEARLAGGAVAFDDLAPMLGILADHRDAIRPLQEQLEAEIQPLRQQRAALGPADADNPSAGDESLRREREALEIRLGELEAIDRRLGQADARAQGLIDRINAQRRRMLAERLLTRQTSPVSPVTIAAGTAGLLEAGAQIGREAMLRIERDDMEARSILLRLIGPILLAIAAIAAVIVYRPRLIARLGRMIGTEMAPSSRIVVGVAIATWRIIVPSVAVGVVTLLVFTSGALGPQGLALLEGVAITLLLVVGTHALAAAYFAPRLPQLRLSGLDDKCANAASRWVVGLGAIYGLDRMLVANADGLQLPIESNEIINLALLVQGGLALWRFERAIGRSPILAPEPEDDPSEDADAEPETPSLGARLLTLSRFLLLGVAICAPLLALTGYFAASRFVFYNPLATAALIGLFVLLFSIARSVVEVMLTETPGEAAARAATSAPPPVAGPLARLRLIPVVLGAALSAAAVPLIAMIWGATYEDLITAWQAARGGFSLGEIRVDPVDIGAFVLVFVLVYLVASTLRSVLARSVLPLTGLDTGGRAAITAGVGYLGAVLAFLAAVAAAGLDLSNLAIVAGALSVGIGFGLQTVVNNFVSGLILLVERPIKAGDWVQLGSGMGYVQRINVRSTVIETFDRASLIVPNAELVTTTVINWTHTNLNGRIIVGVKVAMDADPREVERIMLEIARAHPLVLRRPQPFVLFRGYTDYAMSFEVRAVLRDVNWILNAQSDFYFEIHRRFAEAGIEIPVQSSRITLERALPTGADMPAPGDQGLSAPRLAETRSGGSVRVPAGNPGAEMDGDGGPDGDGR